MEAYLLEWGSMLLRWLHVTAAIAWIGSSFMFMHLDASLRKEKNMQPGVSGVSWQVHGGGFYEMSKYVLAPAVLPDHLVWHKWQSYWTWISGFSLLCWVYYGQSQFFLIDPAVMPLSPWQAALAGIAALALGWIVYDLLCKSPIAKSDSLLALVGFGYVVLTSYLFTLIFSGRGALIHTGALMATIMTANVFFVIMLNQMKSVAALIAGETPEPKWVKESKQRSTHNNYITLPVLFMMLSNHYPLTYSNARVIPAIVTLVVVCGAMIRYFYNMWHADHDKAPWWAWLVAVVAIWTAFWIAMAASPGMRATLGLGEAKPAKLAAVALPTAPKDVVDVVSTRCVMCHAPEPAFEGVGEAPKGVLLDTPEHIAAFGPAIREQAVMSTAMPPNNITEMTAEERAVLARWLQDRRIASNGR
ncbi:MAG TPA: urate hydroxylase PuuD [Roseiarcus sp.]|nr:urate hydroxylase PuuD [Roseiarcus sp.]